MKAHLCLVLMLDCAPAIVNVEIVSGNYYNNQAAWYQVFVFDDSFYLKIVANSIPAIENYQSVIVCL